MVQLRNAKRLGTRRLYAIDANYSDAGNDRLSGLGRDRR